MQDYWNSNAVLWVFYNLKLGKFSLPTAVSHHPQLLLLHWPVITPCGFSFILQCCNFYLSSHQMSETGRSCAVPVSLCVAFDSKVCSPHAFGWFRRARTLRAEVLEQYGKNKHSLAPLCCTSRMRNALRESLVSAMRSRWWCVTHPFKSRQHFSLYFNSVWKVSWKHIFWFN